MFRKNAVGKIKTLFSVQYIVFLQNVAFYEAVCEDMVVGGRPQIW
jgi:hypothetical protein